MKLVIEFDPWSETLDATRAAEELRCLGIPVHVRDTLARRFPDGTDGNTRRPVVFDPPKD